MSKYANDIFYIFDFLQKYDLYSRSQHTYAHTNIKKNGQALTFMKNLADLPENDQTSRNSPYITEGVIG